MSTIQKQKQGFFELKVRKNKEFEKVESRFKTKLDVVSCNIKLNY